MVYAQRIELMETDDVSDTVVDMRSEVVDGLIASHIPENAYAEQWDVAGLAAEVKRIFELDLPIQDWAAEEGIADEEIRARIAKAIDRKMAEKAANYGPDVMRYVEKSLLLQLLDQIWKEHLQQLDFLRQGIGLRAYAQRDPLNEYKQEAFNLFEAMLIRLRETVTSVLAHVQLQMEQQPADLFQPETPEMVASHVDPVTGKNEMADAPAAPAAHATWVAERDPDDPATWGKVGRNAPCPCGTGKKYKHCHGRT